MSDKEHIRKALRNQAVMSNIRNALSSVFSTIISDKRSGGLSSESLAILVAESDQTLAAKLNGLEAMKEAVTGDTGLISALNNLEDVRDPDYRTV